MSDLRFAGVENLYERAGVYYFRRQLSPSEKATFGVSEIRRSLLTRDYRLACELKSLLDFAFRRILRQIEAMKTLGLDTVPDVAREYLRRELENYLAIADYGSQEPSIFDPVREALDAELAAKTYTELAVTRGVTPLIQEASSTLLQDLHFDTANISDAVASDLTHFLCRAHAEVLRIYAAKLRGDFENAVVRDPAFVGRVTDDHMVTGATPQCISVSEAISTFLAAKKETVVPKSFGDYQRVTNWISQWFGETTPLDEVLTQRVREFRDQLARVPAKHHGTIDFVKANAKPGEANSNQTQVKHFGLVKAFFTWAVEEGYLATSPVGTLKLKKQQKSTLLRPFTRSELEQLLSSPLFSGFKSYNKRTQAGKIFRQTPDFWCFMIGLLSGMRVGENCYTPEGGC